MIDEYVQVFDLDNNVIESHGPFKDTNEMNSKYYDLIAYHKPEVTGRIARLRVVSEVPLGDFTNQL